MDLCDGTRRDGAPCTAVVTPDRRFCYHHDPDYAEERRRNASRAATLGNSRIGAEIRSTRLLVRDIVEMTLSNELHPLVKRRLTDVVGLLQVYSRLAELEVAAGEVPKFPGKGYVALPEGTAGRVKQWAEGEGAKERERKRLEEEISRAMSAHGHDPTSLRKAMGG